MEYRKAVKVICPMCRIENSFRAEYLTVLGADNGHPVVVTCDDEIGGCGRWFAISVDLVPSVSVFTLDADD